MNTKKILDSIKDKILFEPIDDRVLIKPLAKKYIKKSFKVPAQQPSNMETAEAKEIEQKEATREVPTNCQLGVVLKIGLGPNSIVPFEPGDIIVYPTSAGMAFELFKDSRLLKRYEILGLWLPKE